MKTKTLKQMTVNELIARYKQLSATLYNSDLCEYDKKSIERKMNNTQFAAIALIQQQEGVDSKKAVIIFTKNAAEMRLRKEKKK
jgi:hypothetical protein